MLFRLVSRAVGRVDLLSASFRSTVLAGYRFACAVCRLPVQRLLVAPHIVPWSANQSLRMNPHNGICLCSLHDKAFDSGALSIGADLKISVNAIVAKTHAKDTAVE